MTESTATVVGGRVATFPETHSPAWWVMWSCYVGPVQPGAPPTTAQLHQSLAGQLTHEQVVLAMADLIHEGRIEAVAVSHGNGDGWALTERGLTEWREAWDK